MNTLQIWFVVISGLLGIGIPFLFLGLELPSAMHSAIMSEAAEYVILDEEDHNFWAIIPGRMSVSDIKSYYIFECTNPEDVAARGSKPNMREVGPFIYNYSHILGERKYYDENKQKDSLVNFTKQFRHQYIGAEPLDKEYRAPSLSGLKRWESVKNKARFQIAIEGFFELFFFARNNLLRDMVIKNLTGHYMDINKIYDLTEGLDIPRSVRAAIAYDDHYGLQHDHNLYEWTVMCDTPEPYIEHEIMNYFGFDIPIFETVRMRFCGVYLHFREIYNQTVCDKIHYCSGYNISFNQWLYGNVIPAPYTYKDFTFKQIFGIFEFPTFSKYFFKELNPDFVDQFKKVVWPEKGLHHLLDTLYEYPDFKTDEASLLLFDNMKRLFEAGRLTQNPYKKSGFGVTARDLDLTKFEYIAKQIKLNKEQAFMMYCYFDYFVNNTVILTQFGGNLEKERVAHYGAHSLWDISTYIIDYVDVVIYSRTLVKRNPGKSCEESVINFFDVPETHDLIGEISNALCNNWYFKTDITKPVGWKYFIEAVSFPYHYYYQTLYNYLNRTINGFTPQVFEAMLFKSHSPFWIQLDDIKRKVKSHYQSKTEGKACENDFSPFCTKRQIFMTQFYQSAITKYPYPEANLPGSVYLADWWKIIKEYMDWTIRSPTSYSGFGDPTPLPDKEIVAPFEFDFLKSYYGNTYISKTDLYHCLNPIGLFDTDTIYNVFLNIRDPSKLTMCQDFASMFFYNATKYFLRNIEFGPMFGIYTAEQVIFGYMDWYIEVEHYLSDYLSGDDCSLNAWIGYNPDKWDTTDKTFEHLKLNNTLKTGADQNSEIRKYHKYYGEDHIYYRKLVIDETGDTCPFESKDPFSERAYVKDSTDGLQFEQFSGKTPQGDTKSYIDSNVNRPMKLKRKFDYDYKHFDLEVNDYVLDFQAEYGCDKGLYIRNAIDMTSFLQMKSVITKPQYYEIDEPGLIRANVTYSYPLTDPTPEGITPYDTYYEVEPYTGITFKFDKKFMTSLAIYYDELYGKLPEGGHGELLPYYSMYEKMRVSDSFIKLWQDQVNSARSSRKAIAIVFTLFGLLFVIIAIGMIGKSFFFNPSVALPRSDDDESLLKQSKQAATPAISLATDVEKSKTDTKGAVEDLQKDTKTDKINP